MNMPTAIALPRLARIMVPLDGSQIAESALPYAKRLARSSGATLVLVRVVLTHGIPGTDQTDSQVAAMEEADRYLEALAGVLKRADFEVEVASPYGDTAKWIAQEVRLRDVDLIVMATHGRSSLGRLVFGSVADAVLGRSRVPILLVRSNGSEDGAATLQSGRPIVVPLDGSDHSEACLPSAIGLALWLGTEIVLVRAVPHPSDYFFGADAAVVAPMLEDQTDALIDDAKTYLADVERHLRQAAPSLKITSTVRVGSPPRVIAEVVRERNASLVAMATHGRTGLSRVLMGSVALTVLQHGTVPMLLVRPARLSIAQSGASLQTPINAPLASGPPPSRAPIRS